MTASTNKNDKERQEPQPHDKFAKCALKSRVVVIDFLAAHWSEIGLSKQELSSIALSNTEHNQPDKSKTQSDVVYRGQIAGRGYAFLLEHQSNPPKKMLIRLMEYTTAIINEDTAQGHHEIPLVLPLCLYHSVEHQRFKHPTTLAGYYGDHKHRDDRLLGYGFKLVDLTIMADEEISTHGNAALMEWLLRDAYLQGDAWIEQAAKHFGHPLSLAACKRGDFFKKASLEYIMSKYNGGETVDEVQAILYQALPPEEQEFMATAFQQLEQRSEQRGVLLGMQQGMQQERQTIAKNMLKAGITFELVKQTTHLSDEELSRLH